VPEREHSVALRIGGQVVERWTDYQVATSLLQPADAFSLTLAPATRDVWDLCRPDAEVQVLVDDTKIVTGFIDDRRRQVDRGGGAVLTVTGRDKGGRLVDESAPLLAFDGLGIQQLAERMAGEWFPTVTLSNARNRRLIRGSGARGLARASREPPIDTKPRARKKVEPGESRWQVLAAFLEEAELLAWSSADGQEFVVGLPNYEQEPQYRFFAPAPGSTKERDGNVLSWTIEDSVAERYSTITVCGAGRGDSSHYGDAVINRRAQARNGDGTDGVGKDFAHPKRLLISDDDVRSLDAAKVRARREMALRDGGGHRVRLTVPGHGQLREGRYPALYAIDCMAWFEDEEIGLAGAYLVTACDFRLTRTEQEIAELELVPKGTVLRL